MRGHYQEVIKYSSKSSIFGRFNEERCRAHHARDMEEDFEKLSMMQN